MLEVRVRRELHLSWCAGSPWSFIRCPSQLDGDVGEHQTCKLHKHYLVLAGRDINVSDAIHELISTDIEKIFTAISPMLPLSNVLQITFVS